MNFAIGIQRYQEERLNSNAVSFAIDLCIPKPMPALVLWQFLLDRKPTRRPVISIVMDIKISAATIKRNIIVSIAGNTPEASILVETISSGSVWNQGEKVFWTKIINPGIRRLGGGDDIFFVYIIKITEPHVLLSLFLFFYWLHLLILANSKNKSDTEIRSNISFIVPSFFKI